MSFYGKIIQIFLSSPGDVEEYRDIIARAIQSWNQRNGRQRKIFFNVLRWEDFVAPDRSDSAQGVVNDQVDEDYNIFLGVMWAKFGTPTDNAGSGTEEEFQRALVRAKSGANVVLSFLFCTKDVPISSLDAEQYGRVQSFKKEIQSEGCLTRDFIDEASLLNAINLILDRFANKSEESSGPHNDGASPNKDLDDDFSNIEVLEGNAPEISVFAEETSPNSTNDDDGEEGIFDLSERFEDEVAGFGAILNEWGNKLVELSASMQESTENLAEVSALGKPDHKVVRPIVDKLAKNMLVFSGWSKNNISVVEDKIDRLSNTSLQLVDFSRDVDEPIDDLVSARDSLVNLSENVIESNQGIKSFIEALKGTPRLTRPMNKAIADIVQTHQRLVEKNRIFEENMQLCAADLSDRIVQLKST